MFGDAIAVGIGAALGFILPVTALILISKHNKKLTPEQKKKSDRNSWIFLSIFILILIVLYLIYL